jgi:hypothetical protein
MVIIIIIIKITKNERKNIKNKNIGKPKRISNALKRNLSLE